MAKLTAEQIAIIQDMGRQARNSNSISNLPERFDKNAKIQITPYRDFNAENAAKEQELADIAAKGGSLLGENNLKNINANTNPWSNTGDPEGNYAIATNDYISLPNNGEELAAANKQRVMDEWVKSGRPQVDNTGSTADQYGIDVSNPTPFNISDFTDAGIHLAKNALKFTFAKDVNYQAPSQEENARRIANLGEVDANNVVDNTGSSADPYGINMTENGDLFRKYIQDSDAWKLLTYNHQDNLNDACKMAAKINDSFGVVVLSPADIISSDYNLRQARMIMHDIENREKLMGSNKDSGALKEWLLSAYPAFKSLDPVQGAVMLENAENVKQVTDPFNAAKMGIYSWWIGNEKSKILWDHATTGSPLNATQLDRLKFLDSESKAINEKMPTIGNHAFATVVGRTLEQGANYEDMIKGEAIPTAVGVTAAGVTYYGTHNVAAAKAAGKEAFAKTQSLAQAVMMASMFQRQFGEKFYEYETMQDSNGKPLLSRDAALTYAAVETGLETGIEFYNFSDVMSLIGGGGKAAVEAIVAKNKGNKEAIFAGLRNVFSKDALVQFGKVQWQENLENAQQDFVDRATHNVILAQHPTTKEQSFTTEDFAKGAVESFVEGIPAVLGMTATGLASSSISAVRNMARVANLRETFTDDQISNMFAIQTLKELKDNQATNELFKSNPEVYTNVVKEAAVDAGMPTVFLDTELLMQEKGGEDLINNLGKKAGLTDEKIQSIKDTNGKIEVPTEVYAQIALPSSISDKVLELTSNSASIDCPARVKAEIERIKAISLDVATKDQEEQKEVISNIVNNTFSTDDEKRLATDILAQYPNAPVKGYAAALAAKQAAYDAILAPAIKRINEGWGKGVSIVANENVDAELEGSGRGVRMSANEPWYGQWYKEHGRQPTQQDIKELAYDVTTGTNTYGIQGLGYEKALTSPEAGEAIEKGFADAKVQLDSLQKDIDTLKGMQNKIAGWDSIETTATKGLSSAGYKVYRSLYSTISSNPNNSALDKSARFNAILGARMMERIAEEEQRQGNKKVTAEDILGRLQVIPDAIAPTEQMSEEAAQRAQELIQMLAERNTVPITGNEFTYKDIIDLRKQAKKYYSDNLQGKTIHNNILGDVLIEGGLPDDNISFTGKGKRKMDSTSAKVEKLLAVKHLIDIIQKSKVISTSPIYKDKNIGKHYFYLHSAVDLGNGKINYVVTTILRDEQGNLKYYNHNIFNKEEYKEQRETLEALGFGNSSTGQYPQQASLSTKIITKDGEIFNSENYNQSAFHGSPHDIQGNLSTKNIGTGEGAQVHGWGLYFSKLKKIAARYRETLSFNARQDIVLKNNKRIYAGKTVDEWYKYYGDKMDSLNPYSAEYNSARDTYYLLEQVSLGEDPRVTIKDAKEEGLDKDAIKWFKKNIADNFEDINLPGSLFKVDVPENNVLLDEQKSFKSQSENVKQGIVQALKNIFFEQRGLSIVKVKDGYEIKKRNGELLTSEVFKTEIEALNLLGPSTQSFDEMDGYDLYRKISEYLYGDKQASEMLNKSGIKGITYDGKTDGRCFVVFDDNAINIINRYNQEQAKLQGQISISQNKSIISLFETANESTFMHEMGHFYLANLKQLAETGKASEQWSKDWNTVKQWLNWKDGQTSFTVEQQEQWARGVEAFLKTGEAPAVALKTPFQKFKKWLSGIYKDFVQLGGKPNKEIAAVMGRMIATQDEVDLAMKEKELRGFEKAHGLKMMDKGTSALWQKWQERIRTDAEAEVMKQITSDLEAAEKAGQQEVIDNYRGEIEKQLSQDRIFKAEAALELANGNEAVLQAMGYTPETYKAELDAKGGSFDNAVEKEVNNLKEELAKDPVTNDLIAKKAQAALQSSEYRAMVEALEYKALEQKVAETVRGLGETGTKEELKETQGNIKVLRDMAIGTVKTYREAAAIALSKLPLSQATNIGLWIKKEQQKEREALKALSLGKWQEAKNAKKEQLTFTAMVTEAGKIKESYDKMAKKVEKRIATLDKGNNRMPAQERYWYQHLAYLLGMRSSDVQAPADGAMNLADLMRKNGIIPGINDIDGVGSEIKVPAWLDRLSIINKQDIIGNRTLSELQEANGIMNAIYKAGRDVDSLLAVKGLNGEKLTVSGLVAGLINEIDDTFSNKKDDKDITGITKHEDNITGIKKWVGSYFKNLLAPQTLLQRIDGYKGSTGENVTGLAIRCIYDPVNKAQNKKLTMLGDFTDKIRKLFSVYKDSEISDMQSLKLYKFGTSMLTKEQVLCLALNMGTEKNVQRVVDGYVLSEDEFSMDRRTVVQNKLAAVQELMSNLTAKDWEVVKGVWSTFDEYWAESSKVEENTTGIPMGKEKATPFTVYGKDGNVYKLPGGYYPVAYDAEKSMRTQDNADADLAKIQMPGNARLGIGRGFTKKRLDKVMGRPLNLSFDVISKHGEEVIHNICFRETVRDINRVINHPAFQEAYIGATSMEEYRIIQRWAKDIWAEEKSKGDWLERAAKFLRTKNTMAVLGYRTSTAILNIANAPIMAGYVGTVNFANALSNFYASPIKTWKFVNAASPFMAARSEQMDVTTREIFEGKSKYKEVKFWDDFQKNSFKLIGLTDNLFAYPLWYSEYQKTVNEGARLGWDNARIQDEAIAAGDRAVIRVIGSGEVKDLSQFQKGRELHKQLTMFYTFFNAQYNMLANKFYASKDMKTANTLKKIIPMAHGMLFVMLGSSLIEGTLRGLMDTSGDDKDPEWWAKHYAKTIAENTTSTLPVLRDVSRLLMDIRSTGPKWYNIGYKYGASKQLKLTSAYDSVFKAVDVADTFLDSINPDKKKVNVVDFARASAKFMNSITGSPDMLSDAITTFWQYKDNNFENDLLELLGAAALDRKLRKTRDKNGKKIKPKTKSSGTKKKI